MLQRGNTPLEWAISILQREIHQELYGTVSFTFQKGLMVAGKVERSEKPPSVETQNQILACKGKNG